MTKKSRTAKLKLGYDLTGKHKKQGTEILKTKKEIGEKAKRLIKAIKSHRCG